jgi:hypothetical protein
VNQKVEGVLGDLQRKVAVKDGVRKLKAKDWWLFIKDRESWKKIVR